MEQYVREGVSRDKIVLGISAIGRPMRSNATGPGQPARPSLIMPEEREMPYPKVLTFLYIRDGPFDIWGWEEGWYFFFKIASLFPYWS